VIRRDHCIGIDRRAIEHHLWGKKAMTRDTLVQCTQVEREAILHTVQQALETQSKVVFAYVYGSFLENRPFHDIDVAVYLDLADEDEKKISQFVLDLAFHLEEALARTLDRVGVHLPVDVRALNRAPLRFCYHVFRGKLLFSRDEALRAQQIERTIYRYLDIKPLRLRALKEAMTA